MTDLQYEVIEGAVPPKPKPKTVIWWLAGGLVVALLAVIGLGTRVYVDRQQMTSQQNAVAEVAAVTAYIVAVNADDMTSVQGAQTSDNSWVCTLNGAVVDGPYKGEALVSQEKDWLSSGLNLATVGTPLVSSDSEVVVQTHATFSSTPSAGGSGAITYSLRDDGSGPKVSRVVFAMTRLNG